ncbi:MAG: FAD binding domain-containing protein [Thermoguttaceae bacterium]|nr:FAD binding domain-containing protein [Thermoguttaceae bacterium]
MNPFQYASPLKLEDAVGLLGDRWGEAEVLAGGTDLVTSLKQEIVAPKRVISLKGVAGLAGIEVSAEEVKIGAMTTLAEIAEDAEMRKHFPSITHAIEGIGSPQIINMATLGGNLCQRPRCWYFRQGFGLLGQQDGKPLIPEGDNRYHAIFGNQGPAYFVNPSSLAPALVALGATLSIAGPGGQTRQLEVAKFYRVPQRADEREYGLQSNEVVTQVTIPLAGLVNATYKVRERCGLDWPLVTASVAIDDPAKVGRASVVLGFVAPTPWPVPRAAEVLQGKRLDEALAAQVGEVASQGATPLSRNAYKVPLVRAAVKRALLIAAGLMEANAHV